MIVLPLSNHAICPLPPISRKDINRKKAVLFPNCKTPGLYLPFLIDEYANGIAKNKAGNDQFGLYGDLRRSCCLAQHYLLNNIQGFLEEIIFNPLRHQWHLNTHKADVVHAAARLQKLYPFNFSNFEDLYDAVYSALTRKNNPNDPTYMGRCVSYDVSLRIGHLLTPLLEPIGYVYVHGYVEKAAKRILDAVNPPYKFRIPRNKFDKACPDFRKLDAKEIEDFLCIYDKAI